MGRNKTAKEIREKHTTIIFCNEHRIRDIVEVLRNNHNHVLWNKSKYNWTFNDWMEYFELKKQHDQILKQLE
jgi:hypothetical protein